MKLYKSQITPMRPAEGEEEFSFSKGECQNASPLLEAPKVRFSYDAYRGEGDELIVGYSLWAEVVLLDSYDAKPFADTVEEEGETLILEAYDEEGDGYVFSGGSFETKELAFCLLRSAIPLSPKRKGSRLPNSDEGISIYREK